ncbi:hypothetical protein, partial [Arcticibacter sp.]|uniref:hypothetical protein n=1 Tax=Arcticibacter sp. TaxID=1872630 RepID=UPI0038909415
DFSTFEVVNYSKAGNGYWVEMTISAVHNEHSEVARYIFVQNIVTSRKLRDVQITEQNTVLKKLAWTNSHLVRKPVASVLGLVELGKTAENVEELKEIQALIEVCSTELDSITKEVATEIYNRNFDGFTAV